ncbi:MAG: hypothetical protein HRT36_02050 [Alphaproteobacteria bacterium]|nr:hypothetical protein [Alphaproteobacteria bacterium]
MKNDWHCVAVKRKKIPKGVREGAWCPVAANQRWSLDFTPLPTGGPHSPT